eukprot:1896124-Amphidinium_carterae.1
MAMVPNHHIVLLQLLMGVHLARSGSYAMHGVFGRIVLLDTGASYTFRGLLSNGNSDWRACRHGVSFFDTVALFSETTPCLSKYHIVNMFDFFKWLGTCWRCSDRMLHWLTGCSTLWVWSGAASSRLAIETKSATGMQTTKERCLLSLPSPLPSSVRAQSLAQNEMNSRN